MEISLASRQITLDGLEVLAQEEENSLALLTDPSQQEQIRQAFAARRQAMDNPEQFSFSVAPVDFVQQMKVMDFARQYGLWDGQGKLNPTTYGFLVLLQRLTGWSGFESQGGPLPCTPENKIAAFGQALVVFQALEKKLAAAEEAEAKNSGTSAAG